MNKIRTVVPLITLCFMSSTTLAGTYIGADTANPELILHPSDYSPGSPIVTVDVCINPGSTITTALEIPVQNVIQVFNELQVTTGNLLTGNNNNVPSNRFDAESVLLHEVGHCIGMAHTNLASESGVSGANQDYTKSTRGSDNTYDLGIGADGVRGSSDDLRGDDVNLHWFKVADNNPFTIANVVDSTTYSRVLANLPSGTYAANPDRTVAALLGFPSTEGIMNQGTGIDEAQRTLAADEVATLRYAASGIDEIAGTADDYTIVLNYLGITNSGTCDIDISVNNESGFAFCSVGFQSLGSGHFRITTGDVRLAQSINWFYNQVPLNPPNMSPVIDDYDDVVISEGESYMVTISATDPDAGDTLTPDLSTDASFCVLSGMDVTCNPQVGDAGVYTIELSVTDDGDPPLTATTSFELTVLPEGIQLLEQCSAPFAAIEDLVELTDSITVSDNFMIEDLDVEIQIGHGFVGDLNVALMDSNGNNVALITRPGVVTPGDCAGQNIDVVLDDEGGDGAADSTCELSDPALGGRLTPTESLSVFDENNIAGTYTLVINDVDPGDTGFLGQWCIEALVSEITDTDIDGDGVFDSVDNCTEVANEDQVDSNGDGFGNACDADYTDDCVVNFLDLNVFSEAFLSSEGDPNYNPAVENTGDGVINFLDFILFADSFLMPPGPSANDCLAQN